MVPYDIVVGRLGGSSNRVRKGDHDQARDGGIRAAGIGSRPGSNVLTLTRNDVQDMFRCTKGKSCENCDKKKNGRCAQPELKEYRSFRKVQGAELGKRYRCDEAGGRCKLKKCHKYNTCSKNVKKEYEKWGRDYKNNCKADLESLFGGGYK